MLSLRLGPLLVGMAALAPIVPASAQQLVEVSLPTGRAPQIHRRDALYDRATGPVTRGEVVLFCRFSASTDRQWDQTMMRRFRAPDITASFRFGDGDPVDANGPEDRSIATVSLPARAIAQGTPIVVQARDRDRRGSEHIGEVRATYNGSFPLSFPASTYLSGECRGISVASLHSEIREAGSQAVEALNALEAALTPNFNAADWGYPRTEFMQAQMAITGFAGFLGWDSAQVTPLVERYGRAHPTFVARLDTARAEAIAALPPASQAEPLGNLPVVARVSQIECDSVRLDAYREQLGTQRHRVSPSDCIVFVEVENRGRGTYRLWRGFSGVEWGASVLLSDGRFESIRAISAQARRGSPHVDEELLLPPRQRATIAYAVGPSANLNAANPDVRAQVLALSLGESRHLMRVE